MKSHLQLSDHKQTNLKTKKQTNRVKKTVAELKSGATVARISHIQLELINNCLTLPLDEI